MQKTFKSLLFLVLGVLSVSSLTSCSTMGPDFYIHEDYPTIFYHDYYFYYPYRYRPLPSGYRMPPPPKVRPPKPVPKPVPKPANNGNKRHR